MKMAHEIKTKFMTENCLENCKQDIICLELDGPDHFHITTLILTFKAHKIGKDCARNYDGKNGDDGSIMRQTGRPTSSSKIDSRTVLQMQTKTLCNCFLQCSMQCKANVNGDHWYLEPGVEEHRTFKTEPCSVFAIVRRTTEHRT